MNMIFGHEYSLVPMVACQFTRVVQTLLKTRLHMILAWWYCSKNEKRSDSVSEARQRSESMEMSDWGDEDDLFDEEDHRLVLLLKSDCSLKKRGGDGGL